MKPALAFLTQFGLCSAAAADRNRAAALKDRSPLRRDIPSAKGSALVEFALAAPLLLLLMAGVLNYALALRTAACVAEAARAGAQYGSRSPASAQDVAGIQAAARDAAPDVDELTATVAQACRCAGGEPVSCGGSCAGGKVMTYAEVTARAVSPTLFNYSGMGFTGMVSARASWRVR